jgi:hypothetical protein
VPESCATLSIPYNPDPKLKPPAPANASDLHIAADPAGNLDLISVDKVGPRDPAAGYTSEGSGTGEINVSGISVAQGASMDVRICTNSVKLPKIVAVWSKGRTKTGFDMIGRPQEVQIAGMPQRPTEGEPVVDGGGSEEVLELIMKLAEQALTTPLELDENDQETAVAPRRASNGPRRRVRGSVE